MINRIKLIIKQSLKHISILSKLKTSEESEKIVDELIKSINKKEVKCNSKI